LVSVYSLLAGYEDLNDGERLAVIRRGRILSAPARLGVSLTSGIKGVGIGCRAPIS
jgi:hypothetical protein